MRKIFLIILCSSIVGNLFAQTWTELGTGSNALEANNSIMAMVTDHSGNVYAAGSFSDKYGYYSVSKWDGSSWSVLGELQNIIPTGRNCLAIDSMDNVYVTFKGSAIPNMFRRWDGTSWGYFGPSSSLGVFGPVAVDKDQHLYASRYMMYMDDSPWYGIDKGYSSTNWGLLGQVQLNRPSYYFSFYMAFYSTPNAITLDASGNVYVAGSFTSNFVDTTYPAPFLRVVKWDGTKWGVLEYGQEELGSIMDLAADQSGNIYAASNSPTKKYVAIWDGTSWSELGTGSNALNANGIIWTLAIDKSGNVYAAGDFTNADGVRYVAKWNGSSWSELGTGIGALAANDIIYDVTTDAVGNVYAAGNFTNTDGHRYVAKWSIDALGVQRKSAEVISFYPNPSNGFSQIRVLEDVELTVYSSLGESIKTLHVDAGTSSVNLSDLTEGLYMLVCRGGTDVNYAPVKLIKE